LKFEKIEGVQVTDVGGKDKFKTRFKNINSEDSFSEIEKLGLIRDAEDLPAKSAFDSICSVLDSLDLPKPSKVLEITDTVPQICVYIMPNNQSNGILEDLCLQSLKNKPIINCISNFSACHEKIFLKEEKEKYNPSKAKVISYLATRAPITNSLGVAAQNKYWDFNHECFKDIKNYLNKLFKDK